jgi:hypothetical protein
MAAPFRPPPATAPTARDTASQDRSMARLELAVALLAFAAAVVISFAR